MLATGHFRNGILLAPLTGERIAATARGGPGGGDARDETIELNGERWSSRPRPRSPAVERTGAADRAGIAVAVDGEVVPRSKWGLTPLQNGQRVEVVGAIQGG